MDLFHSTGSTWSRSKTWKPLNSSIMRRNFLSIIFICHTNQSEHTHTQICIVNCIIDSRRGLRAFHWISIQVKFLSCSFKMIYFFWPFTNVIQWFSIFVVNLSTLLVRIFSIFIYILHVVCSSLFEARKKTGTSLCSVSV